MNEYDKRLMDKPSIETECCPFCGRPIQSRHHIVKRSRGGTRGPTITVCGYDNVTGCHGLLEQHYLHLRYNDEAQCWECLKTDKPTKQHIAEEMTGWRLLRV